MMPKSASPEGLQYGGASLGDLKNSKDPLGSGIICALPPRPGTKHQPPPGGWVCGAAVDVGGSTNPQ